MNALLVAALISLSPAEEAAVDAAVRAKLLHADSADFLTRTASKNNGALSVCGLGQIQEWLRYPCGAQAIYRVPAGHPAIATGSKEASTLRAHYMLQGHPPP